MWHYKMSSKLVGANPHPSQVWELLKMLNKNKHNIKREINEIVQLNI